MTATNNRIHSKGPYTHEEYDAGEAGIYPGMLVKLDVDGDVTMHNVQGGRAEAMFAEEDALQGRTVDQVMTVDEVMPVIIPGLGSEIRARFQDGVDLSIGDRVVSAGDGTLIALGDLDSGAVDIFVIGIMMEALDLTGSEASTERLARIRITAGN